MNKLFVFNFFKINADLEVSGKPPFFVIMGTDPLLQASKLALPNGSFHLEQIIDILVFSNFFKINLWSLYPKIFKFLCSKECFSLGSSPITMDFQSGYLFKIFNIVLPKTSYPFALLSFPIKEIILFLFLFGSYLL